MTLALPAMHPHTDGHVLLRPGFVLDRAAILRLIELGVHGLWIRYPGLESVMKYVSPEVLHEHARLTRLLGAGLDRITSEAATALDFQPYAWAVRSLVQKLAAEPGCQMIVADIIRAERAFVTHASNVCFLSLAMGLKLENYLVRQRRGLSYAAAKSVENLGVGALLHDVGTLHLPPDVLYRYTHTGDEDDPAYQEHVRVGYRVVRPFVEATAAATVLQHHQRFDGRGYPALPNRQGRPRTLRGDQIHVFARICAVADLFDRLRHPVCTVHKPLTTVRALGKLLKEARHGGIDPIVFKALVASAPPYPPGSIVTLNDGFPAVVVEFDPTNPCRPVVQEVLVPMARMDPDNLPLGAIVDLRHHPDRFVERFQGEFVAEDNFEPLYPSEFDLRLLTPPGVPPEPLPATPG